MKRVLVLLICILLCFSFAGCGVIKRPLKSPSGSADKSNTTEGTPRIPVQKKIWIMLPQTKPKIKQILGLILPKANRPTAR